MESNAGNEGWKGLVKKYKGYIIVGSIALAVGFLLAWLLLPKDKEIEYQEKIKIETVEKVEYKDRIVEKVVYQQVAKKHEVIKTITKYIERPDGTKEKTVEEVAETKEEQHTQSESQKEQQTEVKKEVETKTETEVKYSEKLVLPNWHAGATIGLTPLMVPVYGGQIDRRIFGPVFLGVRIDSNPSASLYVGVEF
jgi:hypothetical protein